MHYGRLEFSNTDNEYISRYNNGAVHKITINMST
jgi:hypothetical protein